MSLSEEQILRYSRQLLVDEVGGRGQEAFLDHAVELLGSGGGPALLTAAAYLAAGGFAVQTGAQTIRQGEEGFLFPASAVGDEARPALIAAVKALNSDALAGGREGSAIVAEVPASFCGSAPWVALGRGVQGSVLVFRSEKGCRGCFEATVGELKPGIEEGASVLLGALAALALERLVLGMGPELGGVCAREDGSLSPLEVVWCPNCRG